MFRKFILPAVLILIPLGIDSQEAVIPADSVSFLFIGDIMGHDSQIASAYRSDSGFYDYSHVFDYISNEISEADIAVANLEVTLAGPPYTGYPRFSSPAALASACKEAGIDCLITANNHAADRETEGILRTISTLDSIGILHTGTFRNREDRNSRNPLMIRTKGISAALLSYTYGTNGIRVKEPAIVNLIDKTAMARDISQAKSNNPDLIVIYIHWGTEYESTPSKDQTELADYLFTLGADLIIGSHPHVIQRMIRNNPDSSGKEELLVYSLGNFVSNQRKSKTDGGAMVKVNLVKYIDSWRVKDAGYYLTWVYTPFQDGGRKFYILPCCRFEQIPEFFNNPSDFDQMRAFAKDSRTLLYNENQDVYEYIFENNAWRLYH